MYKSEEKTRNTLKQKNSDGKSSLPSCMYLQNRSQTKLNNTIFDFSFWSSILFL